jgi:hypothetical protein
MPVAMGTDQDDDSSTDGSTDGFTDDRDPELPVLDNPTVRRSACLQRDA